MTRSAEDALVEEHERYMKEVSESGMPLWMLDYYAKSNAQWQEEHLKNQLKNPHHEADKEDSPPHDGGDDPHLFI